MASGFFRETASSGANITSVSCSTMGTSTSHENHLGLGGGYTTSHTAHPVHLSPGRHGVSFGVSSICSSTHGTGIMSTSRENHLGLRAGLSHATQSGLPSPGLCITSNSTLSPRGRQNNLGLAAGCQNHLGTGLQPLAASSTFGPNDFSMDDVYMSDNDDDNNMEMPTATNQDDLSNLRRMCLCFCVDIIFLRARASIASYSIASYSIW